MLRESERKPPAPKKAPEEPSKPKLKVLPTRLRRAAQASRQRPNIRNDADADDKNDNAVPVTKAKPSPRAAKLFNASVTKQGDQSSSLRDISQESKVVTPKKPVMVPTITSKRFPNTATRVPPQEPRPSSSTPLPKQFRKPPRPASDESSDIVLEDSDVPSVPTRKSEAEPARIVEEKPAVQEVKPKSSFFSETGLSGVYIPPPPFFFCLC